jgi:hypothetical protein
VMATRSNRRAGKPAPGSGTLECADLNGTCSSETIKASGQITPRKQAGHMTALDHAARTQNPLLKPGRPHMTPVKETGAVTADNGVLSRPGADGRPRVDVPADVGPSGKHETIHFND